MADQVTRYYFAQLGVVTTSGNQTHFQGLSPALTGGHDTRTPMPTPTVLVLDVREPSSVYLLRYAHDGGFGGDTWHQSAEDAKNQAVYEYGDAVGPWTAIPAEIDDPVAFALKQSASGGDTRE